MSETSPAVPECVVLIGLPGAGKTSFYRERFAGTHDHVSKDLLSNNRQPSRRQELLIDDALGRGRSVVIDNVHAQASTRAPAIAAARRHHAEVVAYFFPVAVADALRRNRARAGRARVPDVAIFAARKRFELPRLDEGFDRLFIVDLDEQEGRFVVRPDRPVTAGVYRS